MYSMYQKRNVMRHIAVIYQQVQYTNSNNSQTAEQCSAA
jgi:hypothetical protein